MFEGLHETDRVIELTREYQTVVSIEDWPLVEAHMPFRAHQGNRGVYARSANDVYLHRLITGAPRGRPVDHKNRQGLDNRRWNLLVTTTGLNNLNKRHRANSLGFVGIRLTSPGRYQARLFDKSLGVFDSPEEAARAYDAALIEALGPFAPLNFPLYTKPVTIEDSIPW